MSIIDVSLHTLEARIGNHLSVPSFALVEDDLDPVQGGLVNEKVTR